MRFLNEIFNNLILNLLMTTGKKGDGMYFIEHGAVSVHLPSGEVVNVLRDGTHFGGK